MIIFIKVIELNITIVWLKQDIDKMELESQMNNGNMAVSLNLTVI